jgi:hypothetical protein
MAKVFVLFGSSNRTKSLKQDNLITFHDPFNHIIIPVSLCLSSYSFNISRIVIYSYHPEYLYRNLSMDVSREYDAALGMAAALGNLTGFCYDYFQQRAARLTGIEHWTSNGR